MTERAPVEPGAGGFLHRVGGDGANAVRPGCGPCSTVCAGRQRRAVPARQRRLVVLGVDRIRNEPVLGAVELVGGNAMLDDIGEHGVDRRFDVVQRHARLRRAVDAELAVVERRARIVGAGIEREPLIDHERAVEPAVRAAAEHMGEDVERFALAGLGRRGRRRQIDSG